MSIYERLDALESSIRRIDSKKKDGWDKIHILFTALLPVAVAFAGYQYSSHMKKAEIASTERQASAMIDLENSRSTASREAQERQHQAEITAQARQHEAEIAAQERQHHAEVSIAKANSRVGQAELITKFTADLFHEDPLRREIAIKGIMIAIPDEGASIVAIIAQRSNDEEPSTDPTIKAVAEVARDALDVRRDELVEALVSSSGTARTNAYEELISRKAPWATDPKLIDVLLKIGEQKFEDKLMVYHVMIVFRDASRLITQPRKDVINSFCKRAAQKHPTLEDEAQQVARWLKTKR